MGRERDRGRIYPNGSQKERAREEKRVKQQLVIDQTPPLTTFFRRHTTKNSDNKIKSNSSDITEPIVSKSSCVNLGSENVNSDSEIPSESVDSEIVIDYVSNNTTYEAHESDIKSELEQSNDESSNISNSNICDEPEMLNIDRQNNFESNNEFHDTVKSYSDDIGQWPKKLTNCDIDYWISKGSEECQHDDSDFTSSKNDTRVCRRQYFYKKYEKTKEERKRGWLCYSPTTKKLYCFPCTLMNSAGCLESNAFIDSGYNDWHHATLYLQRHESSKQHKQAVCDLSLRKFKDKCVDSQILDQTEDEINYWTTLLQHLIIIIIHLATRGLAFRGDEDCIGSPHNGLYLGTIEIVANFSPFMKEHIKRYAKVGKGKVSYLSKTICDEFIELIGTTLLDTIVKELKKCKFYSVSLDSTPDITKIDQLTLIVRYVLPTGPVERYLTFLNMNDHTGEELAQSLLKFLKKHGIDVKDCRGQSYDNASNMSGKYIGCQAKIKELNKFAEFIPCFSHSLNLVGKCAVDSCSEAIRYFDFVNSLYNFFSASTGRWAILTQALKENGCKLTVKRLSDTRWSACAEANKAVHANYAVIRKVVSEIAKDKNLKSECRDKAKGLYKNMNKLETGVMVILWSKILERFDKTTKKLQYADLDLNTACALYESLKVYIQTLRSDFSDIELKAKKLTKCEYYQGETIESGRKRKRNPKYDDYCGSSTPDPVAESLSPSEKFKIDNFIVIIDRLDTALTDRLKAYQPVREIFGPIQKLLKGTHDEIRKIARNILNAYPDDLEEDLVEEFVHLQSYLNLPEILSQIILKEHNENEDDNAKDKISRVSFELQIYRLLHKHELQDTFHNVEIALRIYLSMMVTNCSGERSFSKLNFIKDRLRNSIGQGKLGNLTLMSIEWELLSEMDTSNIIHQFAHAKARKKMHV